MKHLNIFLFAASLILAFPVDAQTACPGGVGPGSALCGPSPAEHSGNRAESIAPVDIYVPSGEWIYTWGAIAVNSIGSGDVGVSEDELSEQRAKDEAIARCESASKAECRIMLVYNHQCAAYAVASIDGREIVGRVSNAGTGESLEVASDVAKKACSTSNAGGECMVIYADCAEAIYIRF